MMAPVVAVDVGNSRIKFGVFEHPLVEPLPHAARAASVPIRGSDADLDAAFGHDPAQYAWAIASVNRPTAAHLIEWLTKRRATAVRQLDAADLPLVVEVPRPQGVGIDRLADAVAVNRLRAPGEPAIIVDVGSAITVDLVTAKGAFAGGAILPGLSLSAHALNKYTDLLPLIEMVESPPALGKSTIEAISSGLYWGTLGGICELIDRLSPEVGVPRVFLTGGAAPTFVDDLRARTERPLEFVPHLTLAGIVLAAQAPSTVSK